MTAALAPLVKCVRKLTALWCRQRLRARPCVRHSVGRRSLVRWRLVDSALCVGSQGGGGKQPCGKVATRCHCGRQRKPWSLEWWRCSDQHQLPLETILATLQLSMSCNSALSVNFWNWSMTNIYSFIMRVCCFSQQVCFVVSSSDMITIPHFLLAMCGENE